MVWTRAINDIIQTPQKEMHFLLYLVCCVVTDCSWQLTFEKHKTAA